MSRRSTTPIRLILAVVLGLVSTLAAAEREHRDEHRGFNPPARTERGAVFDHRYEHDRYYPPRGATVGALPRGHLLVPYHGDRYYFHGGVWYRPSGARFVVVTPPIGLAISVLPPFYTTLWVGGRPYYYADGVYYAWRPSERTYVVTEPPPDTEVVTVPQEPEQLYAYPTRGQSEQQQANDRYECHRWAFGQTGFDPSLPEGGTSDSELGAKRADYNRAIKACLEARGYSVR